MREDIILMTATVMLTDDFIKTVGMDGMGMHFAGPAPIEEPAHDRLISEYVSKYGERPPASCYAYAYDAANMLLQAIERVAVQEKDGTLHIGRQALRDAMYNITDFEGVTGKITCDEFGDCGTARFNIVRLDDPDAGIEGLKSNVVYTYESEKRVRE